MSTQEKMIPVTNVQLHDLGKDGPTRAIGSVTIGGTFVVHGVRVVEGEKGPFVAMPCRRDGGSDRTGVPLPPGGSNLMPRTD
ncbi:MAG: septation protein SpoVG family protein [Bacillota bacterium]